MDGAGPWAGVCFPRDVALRLQRAASSLYRGVASAAKLRRAAALARGRHERGSDLQEIKGNYPACWEIGSVVANTKTIRSAWDACSRNKSSFCNSCLVSCDR